MPHSCAAVKTIFNVGGAQAIAALALGTESVPKVDKIFGPGNAYVTEAKRQVSQRLDGAAIDMPAGPSEVLVIATAAPTRTLSPLTCCRRRNTARTRR
ncbi:histidinol dehydrogenase [Klebsiella pneumoniae]|nr:histidinol dehydrogenase [Klebsiella pneumoniae]